MKQEIMGLREIGISQHRLSRAMLVVSSIFDLVILNKNKDLLQYKGVKKVIELLTVHSPTILYSLPDNLYILHLYDAPENFLNGIRKNLKITTISQLSNLSNDDIQDCFPRTVSRLITKIRLALLSYKEETDIGLNRLEEVLLYELFEKRQQSISEIYHFFYQMGVSIEDSDTIINKLVQENYLLLEEEQVYFPSNIYYKSLYKEKERILYLSDFLNQSFKDKEILLYRLEGKTFEEIGNIYNVSRERIRQKQQKLLSNLPLIYELKKYQEVFEKYDIDYTSFKLIFHEPDQVYYFLTITCQRGTKDFIEYVNAAETLSNRDRFSYYKLQKLYINRFGQAKKITKSEFLDEILYKYKENTHTPVELFPIYHQESLNYPELSLTVPSNRAIEGLVINSKYIISGRGKTFRYYDYNLPIQEEEELFNYIEALDDGPYSMRKIYRDNPDLMFQMDIKNQYELHNYFKRQNLSSKLSNNFKLTRSPEFQIGEKEKKEFIEEIILEFNHHSLNELTEHLDNEFGLQQNTMASYVMMTFRKYVVNSTIELDVKFVEPIKFDEQVLNQLKEKLIQDIYSKKEITDIVQSYGEQLSIQLLDSLNYSMSRSIAYKKDFKNAIQAFSSMVLKNPLCRKSDIREELWNEIASSLAYMERARQIFALDEDLYCRRDFLEDKGIDVDIIEDFVQNVYDFLPPTSYFTMRTLEEQKFTHQLLDLGFESIFYERILSSSELFNPVNRKTPLLLAKGKASPITVDKFLGEELEKFPLGIDIYDFIDEIKEKYSVTFELDDVKYKLRRYGAYVSNDLDKVYLNKEIYLDEVYG